MTELTRTDREFLEYVQKYVQSNPAVGAYVSDFVARGIDAGRKQALERAADMEAALAMSLMNRFPQTNMDFVLKTLRKWDKRSSLEMEHLIAVLETEIERKKSRARPLQPERVSARASAPDATAW